MKNSIPRLIIDRERRVVPRWRSFDDTFQSGELDSSSTVQVHEEISYSLLHQKIDDWERHKTIFHAADLVGSANVIHAGKQDPNVKKAAKFLLNDDVSSSKWIRDIAKNILGIKDSVNAKLSPYWDIKDIEEYFGNMIRHFRELLRIYPDDPVTWVELSRCYTCLGHSKKASRSMAVAVSLAKDNRFVLRSASRLWLHIGDKKRAHEILLKSDRTRHDPWLVSAEIAVATSFGKSPQLTQSAAKMISSMSNIPEKHLSELASALATLNLISGVGMRKVKKLFAQSLIEPTENSIAQAAWVSRGVNKIIDIDDVKSLNVPNTFEAQCWILHQDGKWDNAISECKKWISDQPFSSRPYGYGSYISSMALEDYELSKKFAKQGRLANKSDFILLNNLAFSEINLGNMNTAKELISIMKKQNLSTKDKVVLQATRGLWEFRAGNTEEGRRLYTDSQMRAAKNNDIRLLILSSALHAIEETKQIFPDHSVIKNALRSMDKIKDPLIKNLKKRLANAKNRSPQLA